VLANTSWLCQGCRGWRKRYDQIAACPSCRQVLTLGAENCCRLCWRQTSALRRISPSRSQVTIAAANRDGQQLFLAATLWQSPRQHTPAPDPPVWVLPAISTDQAAEPPTESTSPPVGPVGPIGLVPLQRNAHHDDTRDDIHVDTWNDLGGGHGLGHRQLSLFEVRHDLLAASSPRALQPSNPVWAGLLDMLACEHATAHGWSKSRRNDARTGLRTLAATMEGPVAVISASAVAAVALIGVNVKPVLEILAGAGMLLDDRPRTLDLWFERQIAALPDPMAGQVRTWFTILRDGSSTPPRTRPKAEITVRIRISHAVPVLQTWAGQGHPCLRQITRDHVRAALTAHGTNPALTASTLRSLFRTLKARGTVFADPTTRIRVGRPDTREPVPLDLDVLAQALDSPNPARAALAALAAFHAPRSGQLCALQLTDIRDAHLHLPERTVLLADPVQDRITRWLDHRNARWPLTRNPHLFINFQTSGRTSPVSQNWINDTLGISAQAIREDRILHEAQATGGDIRRVCDLFGLSVRGAQRYTDTLDTHFGSPTPAPG
jgi:integrase